MDGGEYTAEVDGVKIWHINITENRNHRNLWASIFHTLVHCSKANQSGVLASLSKVNPTEVAEVGRAVISAVTACSHPPSSEDYKCEDAIFSVKKPTSKVAAQFILRRINVVCRN
jgi:hypothetical protein